MIPEGGVSSQHLPEVSVGAGGARHAAENDKEKAAVITAEPNFIQHRLTFPPLTLLSLPPLQGCSGVIPFGAHPRVIYPKYRPPYKQ